MEDMKENNIEQPVETEVVAEETVATLKIEEADEQVITEETAKKSSVKAVLKKIGAGIKEWGRKQIVTLKRNPQRIPLLFVIIVSIIWLFWLFTFSKTAGTYTTIDYAGLAVFINTLLSILIIFLFLNAFPKRKKPNVVFIVLVFLFMLAMIGMDVLYYIEVNNYILDGKLNAAGLAKSPYVKQSMSYAIAHIVLQGLSMIVLALLPVYSKLIRKINTAKKVEGNEIGEVDLAEEE